MWGVSIVVHHHWILLYCTFHTVCTFPNVPPLSGFHVHSVPFTATYPNLNSELKKHKKLNRFIQETPGGGGDQSKTWIRIKAFLKCFASLHTPIAVRALASDSIAQPTHRTPSWELSLCVEHFLSPNAYLGPYKPVQSPCVAWDEDGHTK